MGHVSQGGNLARAAWGLSALAERVNVAAMAIDGTAVIKRFAPLAPWIVATDVRLRGFHAL
jgi:hypothetical protein